MSADSNGQVEGDAVVIERHDRVLVITLNRPEAKNAINGTLALRLAEAVSLLDEDAALTVGVARAFAEKREPEWTGT